MRRPWYRSRGVRAAGIAAFALLLAAVAAPFLIPTDRYRQLLVDAIESATGRQVRIDALRFSVFPKLRLHVTGFYVENPAGFPAGDTLAARSVDLGVALRPLLSRRLDVTYIAPAGVQINVLRTAAGRTNVAIAPQRHGSDRYAAGVLTLERIGTVHVKDAAVTLADLPGAARPALELTGIDAKIRSIDPRARDWLKKITVTADVSGGRLTTLLLTKPLVFRTGEFSFEGGAGRGTFSLALGGASITGRAAIARFDPLAITFAVDSPAIDLDALARLVRPGAETGLATSASRRALATGSITAGKVAFAPFETTRDTAHVELSTRAVRLDRYAFSVCGGTVRGSALFDAGAGGLETSGTAQAAGIDVEQALAAFGLDVRSVSGTAQADLRFSTALTHDPERAFTASGTFAVRNGAFPGLDNLPSGETSFSYFGGDLRIANERVYSNDLRLIESRLQATSRGSFGFDRTLSYTGTGVLSGLAPRFSIGGSALAASLRPILNAVVRRVAGAVSVRIPFALHGTFENPQFALAGTPQLVRTASAAPPRPAVRLPSVRDIINLIPGL